MGRGAEAKAAANEAFCASDSDISTTTSSVAVISEAPESAPSVLAPAAVLRARPARFTLAGAVFTSSLKRSSSMPRSALIEAPRRCGAVLSAAEPRCSMVTPLSPKPATAAYASLPETNESMPRPPTRVLLTASWPSHMAPAGLMSAGLVMSIICTPLHGAVEGQVTAAYVLGPRWYAVTPNALLSSLNRALPTRCSSVALSVTLGEDGSETSKSTMDEELVAVTAAYVLSALLVCALFITMVLTILGRLKLGVVADFTLEATSGLRGSLMSIICTPVLAVTMAYAFSPTLKAATSYGPSSVSNRIPLRSVESFFTEAIGLGADGLLTSIIDTPLPYLLAVTA